jgi:hypothetical protein
MLGVGHADVDATLKQVKGYRCIHQVNP